MDDVWRVTGRLDGPALAPPPGIVDRIQQLGAGLGAGLGSGAGLDVVSLLGWRVGVAGFLRSGSVSAGGSCRLLAARDGRVAVNLARDDDIDAVDAWLQCDPPSEPAVGSAVDDREFDRRFGVWGRVEAEVARRPCADLVSRAALLGMPVAALGEVPAPVVGTGVRLTGERTAVRLTDERTGVGLTGERTGVRLTDDSVGETHTGWGSTPVRAVRLGDGGRVARSSSSTTAPVVVDLSSLWAGPLCTRLLADRGARVVKVESATRPDGARRGPRAFFDRLHAGKEQRTVDLRGPELLALLRSADVVVEASRPRALRQLGIVAEELDVPVWVSITGYGRDVDRVAFGDDAAVAGGLVAWDPTAAVGDASAVPCFAGDAIADPLTGVAAAAAVVAALDAGGRWLLDVSMAAVSAWVAGPDRDTPWTPI